MAENEVNSNAAEYGISLKQFRLGASIFALGGISISFLHALWSQFDLTSVIVSIIALTPFLALVFKTMRLAYGDKSIEVEPHRIFEALEASRSLELKVASGRVTQTETVVSEVEEADAALPSYRMNIFDEEPVPALSTTSPLAVPDNVLFVRLRGELEKRIARIAQAYEVPHVGIPAMQVIWQLQSKGVLSDREAQALLELISAGNAQAHGAPVAPGIADFTRTESERLLQNLDGLATKPTQDLVSRIAELAEQNGKMAIVEQMVRIDNKVFQPDIYIPSELLVEVKLRASAPAVVTGLSQLKHSMESLSGDGLLVLGDRPDKAAQAYADFMKDEGVAMAWLEGDTFVGNEKAHQIAPWLFHAKDEHG